MKIDISSIKSIRNIEFDSNYRTDTVRTSICYYPQRNKWIVIEYNGESFEPIFFFAEELLYIIVYLIKISSRFIELLKPPDNDFSINCSIISNNSEFSVSLFTNKFAISAYFNKVGDRYELYYIVSRSLTDIEKLKQIKVELSGVML